MNIEDSLQNWYIYLKSLPDGGPHIDTTCRSIEHKYTPEAGEVFDEEKKKQSFSILSKLNEWKSWFVNFLKNLKK